MNKVIFKILVLSGALLLSSCSNPTQLSEVVSVSSNDSVVSETAQVSSSPSSESKSEVVSVEEKSEAVASSVVSSEVISSLVSSEEVITSSQATPSSQSVTSSEVVTSSEAVVSSSVSEAVSSNTPTTSSVVSSAAVSSVVPTSEQHSSQSISTISQASSASEEVPGGDVEESKIKTEKTKSHDEIFNVLNRDSYLYIYKYFEDGKNNEFKEYSKEGNYGYNFYRDVNDNQKSIFYNCEDLNDIFVYERFDKNGKYNRIMRPESVENEIKVIPPEIFLGENEVKYTSKEALTYNDVICTKYILEEEKFEGDLKTVKVTTLILENATGVAQYQSIEETLYVGDMNLGSSKKGINLNRYESTIPSAYSYVLQHDCIPNVAITPNDDAFFTKAGLPNLVLPEIKWFSVSVAYDNFNYDKKYYHLYSYNLSDDITEALTQANTFDKYLYDCGANKNEKGVIQSFNPTTKDPDEIDPFYFSDTNYIINDNGTFKVVVDCHTIVDRGYVMSFWVQEILD